MADFPGGFPRPPRWMLITGGAGVLIIAIAVFLLTRASSEETSEATSATPTPAATSGSDAPKPTQTNSAPSQSAPPAPIPRGAAFDREGYCQAWSQLQFEGRESPIDDEAGADLEELGRAFGVLHTSYSAASAIAPAELTDDYGHVLGYLEQTQEAITSKDVEQIRIMVTHLSSLNDFMESIDTGSRKICS